VLQRLAALGVAIFAESSAHDAQRPGLELKAL